MARADEIVLKLKADNKQLKSQLKKSQKSVSTFATRARRSMKRLAVGIGIGVVAGVILLTKAFKSLMRVTDAQLKAEKQLEAVLKSTGHAAGLTAKEIKKMASELQKVTTFGDETIIAGQNILLTFTKIGADVFPRATESMLDMSTVLGQDLKQSAILLGKALNDPVQGLSALRRVGVDLAESKKVLIRQFVKEGNIAEAQKLILEELETQMKGSAKAAAQTMGGALQQLKNIMGDNIEQIGKKLNPSLTDMFNSMSRSAQGAGSLGKILMRIGFIAGKVANLISLAFRKSDIKDAREAQVEIRKQMNATIIRMNELRVAGRVSSREFGQLSVRLKKLTAKQFELGDVITGNADEMDKTLKLYSQNFKQYTKTIEEELNKIKKIKKNALTEGTGTGTGGKGPTAADLLKFTGEQELLAVHDIETKKEELIKKFSGQRVNIERAASQQLMDLSVKEFEARWNDVNTFLSGIGSIAGQLSQLADMETQNNLDRLEQERLDKQKIIEESVTDEEQRNIQIEALNNEFDRRKKVMEIKAAKAKKNFAIFETLINIPTAAFAAWKSAQVLPFPASAIVGASMAALATGLGFKKVDLIRKQPLPVLQQGRVPSDHQMAFIGNNEAVINAASTSANAGLLRAINESGGQSVGGQMMQVTSIVNLDNREIGRAQNEFRQDQADDSGLTNFGEGRGAM